VCLCVAILMPQAIATAPWHYRRVSFRTQAFTNTWREHNGLYPYCRIVSLIVRFRASFSIILNTYMHTYIHMHIRVCSFWFPYGNFECTTHVLDSSKNQICSADLIERDYVITFELAGPTVANLARTLRMLD
jgi:hypothetical protein